MPIGIGNETITEELILSFGNSSGIAELMIKVNNVVFNGYLFFILLVVLWIILFWALQEREDSPLINMMYSGASVTIVSFLLRAVIIYYDDVGQGLLSDPQLWIFPLITLILAMFNWFAKE